jgi:hypothetical protein
LLLLQYRTFSVHCNVRNRLSTRSYMQTSRRSRKKSHRRREITASLGKTRNLQFSWRREAVFGLGRRELVCFSFETFMQSTLERSISTLESIKLYSITMLKASFYIPYLNFSLFKNPQSNHLFFANLTKVGRYYHSWACPVPSRSDWT